MLRDLRGRLAASDRDGPLLPGCNCTLIARPTAPVTARSLQGMARVRSGQARAWPLVPDRRGCRVSARAGCARVEGTGRRIMRLAAA
jgi:hypothetical protein